MRGLGGFLIGGLAGYLIADWVAQQNAKKNYSRKTNYPFRHDPPMSFTMPIGGLPPGQVPLNQLPPGSLDLTIPPELQEGGFYYNSPF